MKYPNNKLGKYNYLIKHAQIKQYLPETYLATKANIQAILAKNKAAYLKPNHGTGGFGIYKVSKLSDGFLLQSGSNSQKFTSLDKLVLSLKSVFTKRRYLAQKGVALLQYNNRPFDVRVMIQKNPSNNWEVTGVVGRLASPRKIVTNYHNGGTPMALESLMSPHILKNKADYIQRIRALGLTVSKHMHRHFSQYRAFGVDVAIDSSLKPWILEVNTVPDKYIFNALKDETMFRKIMRYAR